MVHCARNFPLRREEEERGGKKAAKEHRGNFVLIISSSLQGQRDLQDLKRELKKKKPQSVGRNLTGRKDVNARVGNRFVVDC